VRKSGASGHPGT